MIKSIIKFIYIAALATAVLAQNVLIALPQTGTNVTAGSNITLQLAKPMSLTGSEEVSVVIGAFSCSDGVCPGVTEVMGDVLYGGPYNPEIYSDSYDPYENFTVTVPSWYSGLVQLGVAHFFLLGAGLSAQLQLVNVTINVAASG